MHTFITCTSGSSTNKSLGMNGSIHFSVLVEQTLSLTIILFLHFNVPILTEALHNFSKRFFISLDQVC